MEILFALVWIMVLLISVALKANGWNEPRFTEREKIEPAEHTVVSYLASIGLRPEETNTLLPPSFFAGYRNGGDMHAEMQGKTELRITLWPQALRKTHFSFSITKYAAIFTKSKSPYGLHIEQGKASAPYVSALLDLDTRKRFAYFDELALDYSISYSCIWFSIKDNPMSAFRTAMSVLLKATDTLFARMRKIEPNIALFLMENIKNDPVEAIRIHNLEQLLGLTSLPEDIDRLLRGLISDSSWDMRVLAASHLGEEGIEVLKEALGLAPPLSRVRAVHGLYNLLGEKAAELLFQKYGNSASEVKAACIEVFGRIGGDRCEELLIGALSDSGLVEHAISALGACGTVKAVEPLLGLRKAAFLDLALQKKVSDAIAAIQSRISNADSGMLAITETQTREGALRIEDDETGRLGLDE